MTNFSIPLPQHTIDQEEPVQLSLTFRRNHFPGYHVIMAGTGRREKAYRARVDRGYTAQADRKFYRSERFVPTANDWYPPYFIDENGKEVKPWDHECDSLEYAMVKGTVMLHPPLRTTPVLGRQVTFEETHWFVRICFWGNDDTGIEKDAYSLNEESAKEKYHEWVSYLNNIAIACYRDMLKCGGFHHA